MTDLWEWEADEAVKESLSFINTDKQFSKVEHEFEEALMGWHNLLGHLFEQESEEWELVEMIMTKLYELDEMINSKRIKGLKIEAEAEHLLEKLEADIKAKDWKAVKIDIALEERGEKKEKKLRLQN